MSGGVYAVCPGRVLLVVDRRSFDLSLCSTLCRRRATLSPGGLAPGLVVPTVAIGRWPAFLASTPEAARMLGEVMAGFLAGPQHWLSWRPIT